MSSDVRAKCQFPDGVVIKPDGVNVLDPCFYEEIEVVKHCTVLLHYYKEAGTHAGSGSTVPN